MTSRNAVAANGNNTRVSSADSNAADRDRLLRLRDIVGDAKAQPPRAGLIPVGKSTWWAGVASGRFPKPIKIGPGITAWRASDISALIDRLAEAQ